MDPGRSGKRFQIRRIRGEDLVPVVCEKHQSRIDDVRPSGPTEEHTGATPEIVVQRSDIDSGKNDGQPGLATGASAPDLAHNPAVRHGFAPRKTLVVQDREHLAVAPLEGDQAPGVQNDRHATPRPRFPRTVTARARVLRRAAAISSSVISPNSASYAAMAAPIARNRRS